jgi:hypothetical protein
MSLERVGSHFSRQGEPLAKNSVSSATGRYREAGFSVQIFTDGEWLDNRILTFAPVYLIGREPVMRMSTSRLALCCQSGPDAT